jgi:putative ABC transport system permease protein
MIKNYLTIAWRNLLKHKVFSLINILGLAIGIATCMIIFLYVHHELTFDLYNQKADRIARVTTTVRAPESDLVLATTPTPMAEVLRREYPEVETAIRLDPAGKSVKLNNEVFREEAFYETENNVFSVFDFDFMEGTATHALEKPGSIVISSSIAKKYFGKEAALGKIMICDEHNLQVTGVVKDRPSNSDIKIDGLLSKDFSPVKAWADDFPLYTFILFRNKPDLKNFEKKLADLSKKYVQPEFNAQGANKYSALFEIEALRDVHFSKGKLVDMPKGNRQYNYIFSILAVFILLIALLNYINLSTAKSSERAKEVGIRKVSGAPVSQLVFQFLFESFVLIAIACLCSIALVEISLPLLNKMLQTSLTIRWVDGIVFTVSVFLVTLLLAGLYPAFILSSFKPVLVLKGNWKNSSRGIVLRKVVTVTQFFIATGLIMCTTVIYSQMRYIEEKDLGFNKDQLLNIYFPHDSVYFSRIDAFQNTLRQRPEVAEMTVGAGMIVGDMTVSTTLAESDGKKRELMCNYFAIDPHFLSVFGLHLMAGRNLSDSFATDKNEAFLVNEAFVKTMGWKSAVGQPIEGFMHKGKVIGVVKNFYYQSLHNEVVPTLLVYNTFPIRNTSIKIKPRDLPLVKQIYKSYFPSMPINYSFLDEIVNKQYESDRVTMSLFNDFTILAVFVSCLGLYGLVTLIAAQRTKEISIRKVLGATMTQLVTAMSKDFLKLVLVALLIALPVSVLLLREWLKNYAYHISLSWWMFLIPTILVLLITMAVISKEIIRTVLRNPVKSLRSE